MNINFFLKLYYYILYTILYTNDIFATDKATVGKSSVNNNSILSGQNVMPMKGQTTTSGGQFSMMRQIYQRTPKTIRKIIIVIIKENTNRYIRIIRCIY